jgi:fatty-acyl-CoA synthase
MPSPGRCSTSSTAATYDLQSLTVLLSGGAPLSAGLKAEFLHHLPSLIVVDGLGSSEAGGQLAHVSVGSMATTGTFAISPGNHVLSADLDRELQPGDEELGWLAKSGRLALGYLGDAAKTARRYPWSTGCATPCRRDRARLRADGVVELHGRDSVTINSGGEKIFAEEVEAAIKAHADVYDCVVAGRPERSMGLRGRRRSSLRDGCIADEAALLAEAEQHIARYKLPKAFVFVDEVVRSPSGKADYRWAKAVAAS